MNSSVAPLVYVPVQSVLCETLENGAILLHLESGRYFELDAAGVLLWQHLDGLHGTDALAKLLAETYGISGERAAADSETFLRGLRGAGLIKAINA